MKFKNSRQLEIYPWHSIAFDIRVNGIRKIVGL
jgi:hypothetical protein